MDPLCVCKFFQTKCIFNRVRQAWGHLVGTTGNAVARSCVHNGEAFTFQLDGLLQFDYECSHLSSTELKTMLVFNVRSVFGAPACLYVLIHPAHPLKSIRVNWTVERNWKMFIILNQSGHPSFMHPFRSLLDVISILNVSYLTRKREFLWCIYVRSLVTMVTSMFWYGLSKVCDSCVTIISSLLYPPIWSKRMCGIVKETRDKVKTCGKPSSTGDPERHGCILQHDKAEDDTCIFVETDSAVSTFKPQLGWYSWIKYSDTGL